MSRTLACGVACSGVALVSLVLARDGLGHGLSGGALALLLSAGLPAVLARAATLALVALRRPVAVELAERLHGEGRSSLLPALGLVVAFGPLLFALASGCGETLALRQWEAALLGLLAAYALFVAGAAVFEGLAVLAGNRALAYLAATDPEAWVFASDAVAGARRQAGQTMACLLRGVLGGGLLVVLDAGGEVGLSLGPGWSLAGAALASAAAVALTSCWAPRRLLPPLEPLELSPCLLNGAHEWDGAICRWCGARRRRHEGQPV